MADGDPSLEPCAAGAWAIDRRDGAASSLSHVPALDGLRGVAILLVIVYHCWGINPPVVNSLDHIVKLIVQIGWSGVQLFFVLSGFLITGILLDSKDGRHYFRNFYVRRALRIFPLFYAVLAIYLVGAAMLPHHFRPPLGSAAGQEVWYAVYLSNFSMASLHDMAPSTLGVSWSLAVEEQFYLVWPLVVWLLPRRWLLRLCLTLFFVSFFWRLALTVGGVPPLVTSLLTPSQFGGLALGCALAVWQRQAGGVQQLVPWARGLLLGVPPLLFVIGVQAGDPQLGHHLMVTVGLLLVHGFFSACLVLVLAGHLAPRLLGSAPLRACGRWSYGMYLFHPMLLQIYFALPGRGFWPLLFGAAIPKQLLVTGVTIPASAAIAALSWNLYEQPFLRLKRFFPMGAGRKRMVEYEREAEPTTTTPATGSEALGPSTVELGPIPAERTSTPS
jgi:peptidoglycan/LPS O-acetylase OafA/YrhL